MVDYKHINTTPKRRRSEHVKVAVFLVGFVALMGVVGKYEQEIEPAEVAAAVAPVKSATQVKIERLLPEQIAKPIAERTAYPLTMAAIAHTETRGVNRNGDSGESIGIFQIQPKYWGNVDAADPMQQIEKANQIFTGLVARHGYRKAVAMWNGNPENPAVKKYQRVVLAKVRELERGR